MKKILVLTPRFPFPVIGGDRLRIYKLCEQLAKSYELTLLSLCENEDEMKMDVDDVVFKEIHRVLLTPFESYVNVALSIPSSKPLQVAYYKSNQFRKKIDELYSQHDACLAHLIRVGDYIKDKPGVRILEMTDAISLNYKRVKTVGAKNFRSIIYSLEQKRLERYEKKMAGHFDLISFVSDVDKNYLYNDEDKAKVYPNGVDTDYLKFSNRIVDRKQDIYLIFIGNMFSLQNMDAALSFCKDILPRLNKLENKFKFKVIGKIRDSDKRILSDIPNVIVTGSVENVANEALIGHFGICPVRLGAGVQNKILEYMALGLPCITTTVGFEGIGATIDREIFIANTYDDYNTVLHKLINNQMLYNDVALNARQFVQENFSWHAKMSPMLNDISKLLGD